jgi:hypothetical protein
MRYGPKIPVKAQLVRPGAWLSSPKVLELWDWFMRQGYRGISADKIGINPGVERNTLADPLLKYKTT